MAPREYLIVGDSNVRRFYNKIGLQSNRIEFAEARNGDELEASLRVVSSAFKYVVFACLTNLIISAGETGGNQSERLQAVEEMLNTFIPLLM